MTNLRITKPNYTMLPNVVLDNMMPDMSESEFRVVIAVCRKTFGWQKDRDRIAVSQIEKMTGLSHNAVIEGIKQALKRGIVSREPIGQSFVYEIAVCEETQEEPKTSNPGLPVIVDNQLEAKPVILDYQQKKGLKELDADASTSPEEESKTPSRNPSAQQAMVGALATVCEIDLKLHLGKLVKSAARLVSAGYTGEQVARFYGKGSEYYKRDWRGKQGQLPNIATINETIAQAVNGNWGTPSWTKESQEKFSEEQRLAMREALVKASRYIADTPESKGILENKACGLLELGYVPGDIDKVYNIPNGIYCKRHRDSRGNPPARILLAALVAHIGEYLLPSKSV